MPYPIADANGTISYREAVNFAWKPANPDRCLLKEFARDYGRLMGERIDLGELEDWCISMGHDPVDQIGDMLFS